MLNTNMKIDQTYQQLEVWQTWTGVDGWLPGIRRCLHLQDLLFVAEGSNSDDDHDDCDDHDDYDVLSLRII